jgi:hypothetical protein
MIYIGTTGNDGSAIYFDVHAAERQGRSLNISGTIGDGCYEGEVLVEVGRNDSVTFADAWLGGSGFTEFLARCGADALERALLETVRDMPVFRPRRGRPHGNGRAYAGPMACECRPVWSSGA